MILRLTRNTAYISFKLLELKDQQIYGPHIKRLKSNKQKNNETKHKMTSVMILHINESPQWGWIGERQWLTNSTSGLLQIIGTMSGEMSKLL